MNKIAVLLTCHNRKYKTIACLKSLKECSNSNLFNFDVFLTDDGSTDGTGEYVIHHFPEVELIQGTGNLYWNRGMHKAWKTAADKKEYDYYLWLNDDTVLYENALKTMIDAATETDNKSIVVGATCDAISNKITYSGFDGNGRIVEPTGKLEELKTFNGNFVLISKSVFGKVGFIDPLFHHAIGDIDYGLRAAKVGVKSYIASEIIGICEAHPHHPDWCRSEVAFSKRIKSLYSPLGNSHPYYYFRFELRHYGIYVALKHLFTIHLRLFFPQLWK